MNLLLKNATIVSKSSSFNEQQVDILIEKGVITKIGKNLKNSSAKEISSKNLHVSAGWFDMRSLFPDPGLEHKETIESGLNAAAAGGFTGVATLPNTFPVRSSKSEILYALKQSANHLVNHFPYGAISDNIEGGNLAELFDMNKAGAIAFTDGRKTIANSNLMLRALLYANGFNGLIINTPNDRDISQEGKVNEGLISTQLGLKGLPALAEELMINRDLFLVEYTEGKLHLGPISSQKSVDLIKQGLNLGKQVSCEVSIMNLAFTDEVLVEFDTNFKVFPPLRTSTDQKALIKGLKEGTIGVISSNHMPENIENKDVEFYHAAFGVTALETFYNIYQTYISSKLPLSNFVESITTNPRKILGLPEVKLEEGKSANLTLFDPDETFVYQKTNRKSLSANNPLFDKKLKGKVLGIINGSKSFLN
jgi:dihydroorotase